MEEMSWWYNNKALTEMHSVAAIISSKEGRVIITRKPKLVLKESSTDGEEKLPCIDEEQGQNAIFACSLLRKTLPQEVTNCSLRTYFLFSS